MKFMLSLLAIALLSAPLSHAQHADISPRVADGQIVTDGWIDPLNTLIADQSVFGLDFQEDEFDPYFAADPGFNARAGSDLPAGSTLSFNIVDGGLFDLVGNLTYWDGLGEVAFGAVPAGESLVLNLGAQSRTVNSGLGNVGGFTLGTVGSTGSLHRHLNSFLLGSGANDPTDGIYLFAIELLSSDPTIAKSDPLFIVFNNGLDEELHDQAIEWAQMRLVPEPSTLAMGISAVIGLLAWARRSRR